MFFFFSFSFLKKALEDELKARWNKAEKLMEAGRELMAAGHPQSSEIAAYIDSLQKHWKELRQLAEQRKNRLEEAAEAYQVRAVQCIIFEAVIWQIFK